MRGKSFALVGVGLLGLGTLTGCPSTISQTANSGKDYRVKGAKKVGEDGAPDRWRSGRDIVTYPGGDRVDWKVIEIKGAKDAKEDAPPTGPKGRLEIKVSFDVPRPRLDLAFEVYDQYNHRIGRARPSKGDDLVEREMDGNVKKVTIENAGPGKYFVMIYAPRRTDAARYRVSASFKVKKADGAEPENMELPDPPTLAAIPDAPPPPPPCPNDPSKMQPNCNEPPPKPCANDPSKFEPDCGPDGPSEVKGRIVDYTVSARGGIVIKIDKGQKAGVAKGWTGQVVDRAGSPIEGGRFTVVRVTAQEAQGKVMLSVDQVKANTRVMLTP